MREINQRAKTTSKGLIALWAVIGAAAGWIVAALLFLRGFDEFTCVLVSLIVMLISIMYASRKRRKLYLRIVMTILLGGVFVSILSPKISQREPDRFTLVLRRFKPGRFSDIPWGLAGAMLFLCVSLAFAPSSEAEVDSGRSGS